MIREKLRNLQQAIHFATEAEDYVYVQSLAERADRERINYELTRRSLELSRQHEPLSGPTPSAAKSGPTSGEN